ncbi:MAG: hypothetical protein KJ621_17705 [Proteobacteria bacterium]|nr:hypothetical protein [Pseudomonadota bacterium]
MAAMITCLAAASCAVVPVLVLVVASSGGPDYESVAREARRLKIKVDRPGSWSVDVGHVDMLGRYRAAEGDQKYWAVKAKVTYRACPRSLPRGQAGKCFTSAAERMYLFNQVDGRWRCLKVEPARHWVIKQADQLPNPIQTLKDLRQR